MNARAAKQRHEADLRQLRADVLALIEQQKAVIGALARGLTAAQRDIEDLKIAAAHLDEVM